MGIRIIKLPDVGEGVAEAELVEWHVEVGQSVLEDQLLAAVMTDKATVEIPSPVDGEILWLGAEIGDTVAIGSPIVRLKVAGEGNVKGGLSFGLQAGKRIHVQRFFSEFCTEGCTAARVTPEAVDGRVMLSSPVEEATGMAMSRSSTARPE